MHSGIESAQSSHSRMAGKADSTMPCNSMTTRSTRITPSPAAKIIIALLDRRELCALCVRSTPRSGSTAFIFYLPSEFCCIVLFLMLMCCENLPLSLWRSKEGEKA